MMALFKFIEKYLGIISIFVGLLLSVTTLLEFHFRRPYIVLTAFVYISILVLTLISFFLVFKRSSPTIALPNGGTTKGSYYFSKSQRRLGKFLFIFLSLIVLSYIGNSLFPYQFSHAFSDDILVAVPAFSGDTNLGKQISLKIYDSLQRIKEENINLRLIRSRNTSGINNNVAAIKYGKKLGADVVIWGIVLRNNVIIRINILHTISSFSNEDLIKIPPSLPSNLRTVKNIDEDLRELTKLVRGLIECKNDRLYSAYSMIASIRSFEPHIKEFVRLIKYVIDSKEAEQIKNEFKMNIDRLLKDPDLLYEMGVKLVKTERYGDAMEIFNKLFEINSSHINGLLGKAVVLRRLGRYEEALQIDKKVLAIEPLNSDITLKLAIDYHNLRKYDEAEKYFRKAIDLSPGESHALYNYGRLLFFQNRVDEAVRLFRRVIEITNTNMCKDCREGSANYLGIIHKNRKDYDKAIEYYKIALDVRPDSAVTYSNWGIALKNKGHYEEAIDKYNTSLKLQPDDASVYYNWAVALKKLGSYEEACEKYEISFNLDPYDSTTLYSWADLLKRMGRYMDANEKENMANNLKTQK